ncbi:DUF1428 family protein [Oceanobacillus halotolerans]|uniref:DUF1428 family protein n=1 Tax=Oceanobacillus halotolerans TaxID=2663380 RepID=UPI0013DA3EB5|nr:DUF1428 family protein [Oceanobacillus halotolerans]
MGLYTVIYLYRVKKKNIVTLIDLYDQINDIYLANGALENTIYRADDLTGKGGCIGLEEIIPLKENETLFFSQAIFRNLSHYEEVTENVKQHEEFNQLLEHANFLVNHHKAFRSSFSTID